MSFGRETCPLAGAGRDFGEPERSGGSENPGREGQNGAEQMPGAKEGCSEAKRAELLRSEEHLRSVVVTTRFAKPNDTFRTVA